MSRQKNSGTDFLHMWPREMSSVKWSGTRRWGLETKRNQGWGETDKLMEGVKGDEKNWRKKIQEIDGHGTGVSRERKRERKFNEDNLKASFNQQLAGGRFWSSCESGGLINCGLWRRMDTWPWALWSLGFLMASGRGVTGVCTPPGPCKACWGFPEKACQPAEVLGESAGQGEVWGNTEERNKEKTQGLGNIGPCEQTLPHIRLVESTGR